MHKSVHSNAYRNQQSSGHLPWNSNDIVRYGGERDELKPIALGYVGVAITSPNKKILQANDQLCEMLGYNESELRAITWPEFTYPPDLPQDLHEFRRMCAGEIDKYSLPKRFIRKPGDVLETVISVTCVRKPNGAVDSVVGLVEAIRARQQPQNSLHEFVKQLSSGHGRNREVLPVIQAMQKGIEPYRAVGDAQRNQLFRPGQVTKRELNVLTLLAEGLSHKAVGERLQISVRTVDAHARNIMRKVGLRNISDLVRFALRNEIISK